MVLAVTSPPSPPSQHFFYYYRRPPPLLLRNNLPLSSNLLVANSFSSDDFPVGPKSKETEEEAQRRNWIKRGWAPWEEILTPEANFACKSLNEEEEVLLRSPKAIEAFKMLNPRYRKKMGMGKTEEEYQAKQFEIKGEILDLKI